MKTTFLCCVYVLSTILYGHCNTNVAVVVDPVNGSDDDCTSAIDLDPGTTSNVPCSTLNYAVRGNISLDHFNRSDCMDNSNAQLTNVQIVLRAGVHQLTEQLVLSSLSSNVTFLADHNSQPIVRCVSFPNYEVSNYDNIFSCGVDGVTFKGITFEKCGPIASNVFVRDSDNVRIDSCTFRNNSGTSLQTRFTPNIQLLNTVFQNNINNASVDVESNETTIEDLYQRVQTSGGVTIFIGNETERANVLIDNCTFEGNSASNNPPNDTRPVLLKQNGHGGALLIRLDSTQNSTITVTNSNFTDNHAQVDGAGIYVSYSDQAEGNVFIFRNLNFDSNIVEEAAGGAMSVNSFYLSFNNNFIIEDCIFTNNRGSAGGAFSMALYDSSLESTEKPDGIQFTRCHFINNFAVNEGTAVGLFSLVHVDQVGFPVNFSDCKFINNTSGKDTSAVAAFRFPTEFKNTNEFIGNFGGGVMLLNTRMAATENAILLFQENRAVFGGGIMMDDRCLLEVSPNVTITFINNHANESGGGIYVEFPPIRFVIDIFNRLCFLQYNDGTGVDKEPQLWERVNISFINNNARLSGAAIYASDMQRCSWLGNEHNNCTPNIFHHPGCKHLISPFRFINNKLEIENNSNIANESLATAPLRINPSVQDNIRASVQPGETVAISLHATDQLDNTREAIWALDSPFEDTVLDALSAENDTYFYTVPSITTSDSIFNLTLNFSLLKTLGISSQLSFNVSNVSCHPGFSRADNNICNCNTGDSNILRCDDDKRYIYLREGIWSGGKHESSDKLLASRVLPGFTGCTRQGRLPGCLYKFDSPDEQCVNGRGGRLCGKCIKDYHVTLDLQSCRKDPEGLGITLFILLSCIGLFVICFLILWFDVPIPNELKAFIFYVQVIGLVYRPYSVVTTQASGVEAISVIVNLLGFSNPLPVSLSPISAGAQYVALLGFIPPLIILLTILGFAIGARFIRQFAHHSALKGITTLSVFCFKYLADTSFVFLSCVRYNGIFVFQYDGTSTCTSPYFMFMFIVALLTVIFVVFPLPVIVSYVCMKRPQYFQAYADVLTDGLKPKHHWWGGWDLGRRLFFVVISFFVVLARPSLILFFMSIAALVVMIVHIFSKPYVNKYTNIIEAAILLDLLLVTGAFLDPSSEQVPNWFAYILVFLPYVYCFGYICWIVGKRVKKFINKRRPPVAQDNKPVETSNVTGHQTDAVIADRTTGNSNVTTTSGSGGSSAGGDNTMKSGSSEKSATEPVDTSVKLREPLLDDL